MPTIVHTLASPISTCHSAPDDAPYSLDDDARRPDDEADPAEFGRRRPFCPTTLLDIPPALDDDRLVFLTRPPSLLRKSDIAVGEEGALSGPVCPK